MYGFDDRRRPLYIFRLASRIRLEELALLERDTLSILERRESYVSVMDLAELQFPSQEVLAAGAKMSRRLSDPLKQIYESSAGEPHYFSAYVMGPRMAKMIDFLHRVASRGIASPTVFASVELATAAAEQKLRDWGSSAGPPLTEAGSAGPSR